MRSSSTRRTLWRALGEKGRGKWINLFNSLLPPFDLPLLARQSEFRRMHSRFATNLFNCLSELKTRFEWIANKLDSIQFHFFCCLLKWVFYLLLASSCFACNQMKKKKIGKILENNGTFCVCAFVSDSYFENMHTRVHWIRTIFLFSPKGRGNVKSQTVMLNGQSWEFSFCKNTNFG